MKMENAQEKKILGKLHVALNELNNKRAIVQNVS